MNPSKSIAATNTPTLDTGLKLQAFLKKQRRSKARGPAL
jgi:hypothetical protein